MTPSSAHSWIEISRSALLANARHFQAQLAPKATLLPVLKSNAYGHGMELVARMLAEDGCRWFGLFSAEEALRLSALPELVDPRFLVFSFVPPELLAPLVRAGGRATLFDFEQMAELEAAAAAAGLRAPVHAKLETGLHRQGFREEELDELAPRLSACPHLKLEGIYTHFANIEDTTDHSYAYAQMERFRRARVKLAEAGLSPELVHASCSAAGILFPEMHLDLLRVGISLYGHWSSRETRVSAQAAGRNRIDLRPALSWKTRILHIKRVPAGSMVGYGCSWKAEADTRIGVLPVGYFDGYDRGLGAAHVLVRGHRAPLRGRIMMNHCLVDLGHIPDARRGDEVVLIGRQGSEQVTAELLAELTGTINYEILSRLGPHLPRVAMD